MEVEEQRKAERKLAKEKLFKVFDELQERLGPGGIVHELKNACNILFFLEEEKEFLKKRNRGLTS